MGMSPNSSMGMFMSGAGMAASTAGAYKTAAGQKAALKYQANVAANNAEMADAQAQAAIVAGQREEQAVRLKTASTLADQKAIAAANGVDIGSGSPLELMASTKIFGEDDALTVRDNANRTAWAYRQQGRGFRNEAAMDRSAAGSISPWMSAGTSLLTSAGAVSDKWYRYRESTQGKGR